MRLSWLSILLNLLGFKACWLACIFGAANHQPWIGPLAVAVWCAIHLSRSPFPQREAALILIGAAIGASVDVITLTTGFISYHGSHTPTLGFIATFFALWVNFGTTLRISFQWSWRKPIIAAAMGALGGPFAYWSGAQAGAIEFPSDMRLALLMIAIQYGVALPIWFAAADRLLRKPSPE